MKWTIPLIPFAHIFERAHQVGLGVTIHGGEWAGAENVQYAVEHIGASRIGHGVRAVEDSEILQYVTDQNTYFEVCPTSNMQTGVVTNLNHHPLIDLCYMNANVTINTDDPAIHNLELTDEYALAIQGCDLPLAFLKKAILNAVDCAFLPQQERIELRGEIEPALIRA